MREDPYLNLSSCESRVADDLFRLNCPEHTPRNPACQSERGVGETVSEIEIQREVGPGCVSPPTVRCYLCLEIVKMG